MTLLLGSRTMPAMDDRPRLPPFATSALARVHVDDRGTFFKGVTDRLMALASKITREDLDEQISKLLPIRTLNEIGVDPFGIDIDTTRLSIALLVYLHRFWFRTEVHDVENVPTGRALIVSNHSGQIPLDGVVIALCMALDSDKPRFPRAMLERFVATLPFFSVWFPRVGQVLGTPENARHLLEKEEALIVFPEGVKGIAKTYSDRYKLAPFGPGFMRLALETQSPIVPVAVIGAEEQYPSVTDLKPLARLLGLPALPIVPQLFMGWWLPLPTKYRVYFGEPLTFNGDPDDDDATIEEKVWVVQATIQSMVNRGLKERRAVFW
ncbi:MAG TPA: lysophospholipid acyltransferase family protein [Polyangiales bacterium]|nr:lysophospholipid acyltransferase family protein [Polyangiales bacterium]